MPEPGRRQPDQLPLTGLLLLCWIMAARKSRFVAVFFRRGTSVWPGNVGTAIRTANALGMDAVVLTGACADLYGPKTVRATMGALFRQPVLTCATDELMQLLRANGLKLYGAALTDTAQDLRRVPLTPAAVAIGSEGRGLSAELLAQCDGQIIIPMQPGAESLNAAVAAAVVMWEIARTET